MLSTVEEVVVCRISFCLAGWRRSDSLADFESSYILSEVLQRATGQ
jgi:hypothetical protein